MGSSPIPGTTQQTKRHSLNFWGFFAEELKISTNNTFSRRRMKMGKKDSYRQPLKTLFDRYLQTGNTEDIKTYLAANSNLPGPRGNLELAYAFADTAEEHSAENAPAVWKLALELAAVPADEAPVNDPKEFLPFCGVVSAGAVASVCPALRTETFSCLRRMATDSRWRTREGVAMGIQRLVPSMGQEALDVLGGWVNDENWLVMRAVAAGVAEPALLKAAETAREALGLHKKIFTQLLGAKERTSVEFRTLRQALGYSLSVVVCYAPSEGFAYMQELVASTDADVLWVVKENLKKNRLIKNFPVEVAAVQKLLLDSAVGT